MNNGKTNSKPRALYFKDHELEFLKFVLEEKVIGYTSYEKGILTEPLTKITNEIKRRASDE